MVTSAKSPLTSQPIKCPSPHCWAGVRIQIYCPGGANTHGEGVFFFFFFIAKESGSEATFPAHPVTPVRSRWVRSRQSESHTWAPVCQAGPHHPVIPHPRKGGLSSGRDGP